MKRLYLGLGGVALATLAFETLLTRVFSLAQGYHFAFMVVSIALLGYGASGTLLALWPTLLRGDPGRRLSRLAMAFTTSLVGAHLFVNLVPFDSYSIAWDRRQAFLLAGHYLALAVPFLLSGLAVALLLARYPHRAFRIYGVNMAGSALGKRLMTFGNRFFAQSAAMGALPEVYAATAPDVRGGDYIGPDGPLGQSGFPKKIASSRRSRDHAVAARLWQVSEALTGIEYSVPHSFNAKPFDVLPIKR